jgi:hypothetical protein
MVSAAPPPTDLTYLCILVIHPSLPFPLSRLPPPPHLGGSIILLYNLRAHNVMTNIIVDAGTNANFQKRDLEIVGLATLEPIEVFSSNQAIATQIPSPSNRPNIDDHHDSIHYAIPRPGTSDGVHTPASSSLSLTFKRGRYIPNHACGGSDR